MKKVTIRIILILTAIILVLCIVGNNKAVNKYFTERGVEKSIVSFLEHLSDKDLEGIKETTTKQFGDTYNEATMVLYKTKLDYAELKDFKIRESSKNRVIVDAKVMVVCYTNINTYYDGDWIPGKSYSNKSFELIKEGFKWHINGWGKY